MNNARDQSAHANALPGRIGARYEVIERLGRGGMAAVYRVRDRSQQRELALKQLILQGAGCDHETRSLFDREFCVLSELRHPGIVEVYDFGVDAAGAYYTMELLDTGDLSVDTRWPVPEACQWMMQVCSALSLLHCRRYVHRDISPRNVRRAPNGSAKLIDFGAMVPVGPCRQSVGTPGFIAPEVVHHLPVDARTDLFSVGATLYYALTGCRAFSARTLAELAECWHNEPPPPSALVPEIPKALDALVLSLLRLDPARRPSSAFEVMQRLAAIVGQPAVTSIEVARGYLSTPLLVARDAQLRRFRQALRRAMHGDRSSLFIEGTSGLGRSRVLEACTLEAKTSGATVLSLDGRAARPDPCSAAHRLAEQLLETLDDEAQRAAVQAGAWDTLFPVADPLQPLAARQLGSREHWAANREAAQAALLRWLRETALTRTLLIAIDDVERVDEASLALLVALVYDAASAHLLLMCTAQAPVDSVALPALGVLRTHSSVLKLAAFSARETDELFSSVFFGVPNASLLADRIHQLAAGNPRKALALAQNTLDRSIIRFADGNWILPPELSIADLPTSAEEALRFQIAQLPGLERSLAEAQALALEGPWTYDDYRVIAGSASAERVAQALDHLLRLGVIIRNTDAHTLCHLAMRVSLLAQLTADDRLVQQHKLAELCARNGRGLAQVYHLLQAENIEPALDRLSQVLRDAPTLEALYQQSGVDFSIMAQIIERAHERSIAANRNPRERHDLARLLLGLSIWADTKLYHRYAPAWLEQLQLDSGLSDYRALSDDLDSTARLQNALQASMARYTSTPEAQRVYRVDEAVRELAAFVAISVGIGVRTLDGSLLRMLPSLLEPFATLSPLLYALWQNALATTEVDQQGRYEQALTRIIDVYERLTQLSGPNQVQVDQIRYGVAHGIASLAVLLGHASAERWVAIMAEDPQQRVAAAYLQRALCILDGDVTGAEAHRKQAEVFAVQSPIRQMFDVPLIIEIFVQTHAGDLTGLKQAADRISQLASEWPGWRPQHFIAQACFHSMRGDLTAAHDAAEQALAEADPEQVELPRFLGAWAHAAAIKIRVLGDLGRLDEAREFGRRAYERSSALGLTGIDAQIRALAIVEAKLGEFATAAARLDTLIAQRGHLRPSLLALDLETRARVAILAGDSSAAGHFTQLATQDDAANGGARLLTQRRRLLDEAQSAGLRIDVSLSGFESTLLGSMRPVQRGEVYGEVTAALPATLTATDRAEHALGLLSKALNAAVGQLYYANAEHTVRTATLGSPDGALDRFVAGYWQHRLAQASLTTIFTVTSNVTTSLATTNWTSSAGKAYRVIPLSPAGEAECIGLVALPLSAKEVLATEFWALAAAVSARLLELGDVAAVSGGVESA